MSTFAENCEALRWLRERYYVELTKWEQGFVDDLADRVENGQVQAFTAKQEEVIDRLWDRYVLHPYGS